MLKELDYFLETYNLYDNSKYWISRTKASNEEITFEINKDNNYVQSYSLLLFDNDAVDIGTEY